MPLCVLTNVKKSLEIYELNSNWVSDHVRVGENKLFEFNRLDDWSIADLQMHGIDIWIVVLKMSFYHLNLLSR